MIHPNTEVRFINDVVGLGVVATAPIGLGTLVWVQDSLDRTFSPEEVARTQELLRNTLDKYSYRDRHGHYVYSWDHAIYMNHSFDPNCLLTPYGLEIAIRDISVDEELTIDYGCYNIIEPFEPCPEDGSRKMVRPDDLGRCHEAWDRQIMAAVRCLPEVEQPLRAIVEPAVWQELCAAASGAAQLRSVATMLCRAVPS